MQNMSMEDYYKQFDSCRQNERPYCTDICPFHMDVLDFQAKMVNKRFNAAYKIMRNAMVFPEIVAELCPEYCAAGCPRKDVDEAIRLNLLERACISKAAKKEPTAYNLPAKPERVAVVGAGASGLACALKLATKKYQVTIYEKSDRVGGSLHEMLPSDLVIDDIKLQFMHEEYELKLNYEVKSLDELSSQGFNAVYVATGEGGREFGLVSDGKDPYAVVDGMAVFAGGSLLGKDIINAIADGSAMAWAMEVFIKTNRAEYPNPEKPSLVVADLDKITKMSAACPDESGIYTDEEVVTEAGRCIRCQCDACRTYCDLTEYLDKWPRAMRDEIMTSTMPSASMVHKTPAIRYINMCTQCGLFEDLCPANIELSGMMKEARYKLHNIDKMPRGYHQFWLRDMEFANGPYAKIVKKAPDSDACSYAFFPGCHLGETDTRYVTEPYKWLLEKRPDTGLMLRCCGVPADWAGNEELHNKELVEIREEWEALGKPVLILACASCGRHIKEYLPEIEIVTLYEIMEEWGFEATRASGSEVYSVFDPCSARNKTKIQSAVRTLAERGGYKTEELPKGDKHGCCGFGGLVSVANADFADFVAKERISMSEHPYIVYCSNCKDVFKDRGKPALHILDLMFDIDEGGAERPDLTERRNCRIILKETLLENIWKEKIMEKPEPCQLNISMSPEVRDKINKIKLLEENICEVIEFAERTKRRTYNPEKDSYTCYKELGYITCWIEYREDGQNREILNAYTHRMKIELEAVWNGRKTEIDM